MVSDTEKRSSAEAQMNVITFCGPKAKAAADDDPHGTGVAVCAACRHEWIAVAPAGTILIECPECRTVKGRFKYDSMPADGSIWVCGCGCDLFRMTEHGTLCINCGKHQLF